MCCDVCHYHCQKSFPFKSALLSFQSHCCSFCILTLQGISNYNLEKDFSSQPDQQKTTGDVAQHYLWNVNSGPEELQVFTHLLWLVLGVEDAQLREHAHVCALQTCWHSPSKQLVTLSSFIKMRDACAVPYTWLSKL